VNRVTDTLGRPLKSLRLSVIDRCNLRCAYCMPEQDYAWLPKADLLSFEELGAVVDAFEPLGVRAVRLTGGEALLRRELPTLVRALAAKPSVEDLSLTTNGLLLAQQATALQQAGLHRLTVSLDTLSPDRFKRLTRRDAHADVLAGLRAAASAGFPSGIKIDTVLMRGVNDDELIALLDFAATVPAELRFIEYMDVGGATRWRPDDVVTRAQVLAALTRAFGDPEPLGERGAAPAERFRLPDGRVFGIVASTSAPFCRACDRGRLTADGTFFTCLYATEGLDLKSALRGGASSAELSALLARTWSRRGDRGAEERLRLIERGPSANVERLKAEPRLEMHTRGG
jgi:cyclic pyranopterin phosphate synthase